MRSHCTPTTIPIYPYNAVRWESKGPQIAVIGIHRHLTQHALLHRQTLFHYMRRTNPKPPPLPSNLATLLKWGCKLATSMKRSLHSTIDAGHCKPILRVIVNIKSTGKSKHLFHQWKNWDSKFRIFCSNVSMTCTERKIFCCIISGRNNMGTSGNCEQGGALCQNRGNTKQT